MKSLIAAILGAFVLTAGSAQASIRCNGAFQVVNGSEIATPYCQDENLARLARNRGMDVTGHEIRNDLGRKLSVCRMIGKQTSARSACASMLDN